MASILVNSPGAIFVSEKKPNSPTVSRREKLAAELRANLKRRKAKTRLADQEKAKNPAKPEQAN